MSWKSEVNITTVILTEKSSQAGECVQILQNNPQKTGIFKNALFFVDCFVNKNAYLY